MTISFKLAFFILAPIFAIIAFVCLRHYNSGLGGSLRKKAWALRIGIISGICFIIAFIFYFVAPKADVDFNISPKNLDWIFTILNGIILLGGYLQNEKAKENREG
jgi:hypothetical protein